MSQERSSAGQRNVGWVQRSWLFLISILAVTAVAWIHAWLAICKCGLAVQKCHKVCELCSPDLYAHFSWHIPWLVSIFAIGMIIYLRETHQAWRMRYAICWMILFAVALGYMCVYHWDGLQGNQSPAETLGNIGLAAVGVATLLFVVWRGRLVLFQSDFVG